MNAVKLVGPKKTEMGQAPQPEANAGIVVIRVDYCGICGSDIHIWENGVPDGLIMGHEFAGAIVDTGAASEKFKAGDRVTALPVNPCGACKSCLNGQYNLCLNIMANTTGISVPGAYAEYVAVSALSVRKIPDGMSQEEGAMAEPSAVALHAVNLAGIKPGDKVLIVGGGIIGLLSAAWARICGAGYIGLSEVNAKRAQKALAFGDIDEVFDATDPKLQKKLLKLTKGGFSKVIECAGPAPAVNSAIGAARAGATVVLAGINFDQVPVSTMRIAMRELTLKGSYGYSAREFDQTIDYMGRNVLQTKRFIDETVGLDGVQDALVRLADPTGEAIKVLIKP